KDILLGIGDYLRRFGESVYSTRAWTTYGEGPTHMGGGAFTAPKVGTAQDIRFTRSKNNTVLYATVLGWPGSTLTISTLDSARINVSSLTSAKLLNSTAGTYTDLPTPTQDSAGLHVTLPSSSAPFSALAYVVKLTFSGQIPALQPLSGAVVYQDVNYLGGSSLLQLGSYTADQLSLAGLPSRSLSSLKPAPGYQIIGYSGDNFTGTAWTFNADNADLRVTGNNDAVVSMKVQLNPSAWFRITNVTDGLVLDSGGNVPGGSNLKQWTWNGSTNLQWQAVELGNGYYKLVNRANGMVADGGGATTNGSPALEATWTGGNSQQWQLSYQGGDRYWIRNRATGLVLDGGGDVPSGSVTKQWSGNSSTDVQWTFTKV
ncbi:MAG: alpha-L-fucosidase, partial [Streptomyces sp.]|nr:alpha-L-fucosidase [Streptomyces sp.]